MREAMGRESGKERVFGPKAPHFHHVSRIGK